MIADVEADRVKWAEAIQNIITPPQVKPVTEMKPSVPEAKSSAPGGSQTAAASSVAIQEVGEKNATSSERVVHAAVDQREQFLSKTIAMSSAFLKAWVHADKESFEALVTDDFEMRVPLLNAEIKGECVVMSLHSSVLSLLGAVFGVFMSFHDL